MTCYRCGHGPCDCADGITIYHGDCREILLRLDFDVIVTDPPYGITLRSGWNGAFGDCAVEGDGDISLRDWLLFNTECPSIIFGSPRIRRPAEVVAVLVWDKGEHVGMGDLAFPFKPNWEEIYVIGNGWQGTRRGSVLRHLAIAGTVAQAQGRYHPTEKPVSLMADLIKHAPAGTILDPFMGSGTTLRAAKDLGRKAIGIEIEEKYCFIAANRLRQEVLTL